MTGYENLSTNQKIRATIHRDTRTMCSETCHLLGLEITKPAMEVIAELVYRKMQSYGTDLEAFAHHAKRNTVNNEDVKLLVRRNQSLKNHLTSMIPSNPSATKEKRRKTIPAVAKQPETSKIEEPIEKKVEEKIKEDDHSIVEDNDDMAVDETIDLTFF